MNWKQIYQVTISTRNNGNNVHYPNKNRSRREVITYLKSIATISNTVDLYGM
jgi:hypothetical protein